VRSWPEIEGLNEMKKERLFIFWLLAIIIASVLLIFLKPQETINNIIQAIAIITLIFVTWVYAKRTKDLVDQEKISLEEEKKKRDAEFWARAIEEFYIVFLDKVKEYLEVFWPLKDLNQKISLRNEISKLIGVKGYMISKETKKRILELSNDFLWVDSGVPGELIEKAKKSLIAAVKIIDDEKKRLDDKLRKFYEVGGEK